MWLSKSSVGRKVVMSVTGAALVLFLLFHMSMNLVAIISTDVTSGFMKRKDCCFQQGTKTMATESMTKVIFGE